MQESHQRRVLCMNGFILEACNIHVCMASLIIPYKEMSTTQNSFKTLWCDVMSVRVRPGGLVSFGLQVSSDCDGRSLARAVCRYCTAD